MKEEIQAGVPEKVPALRRRNIVNGVLLVLAVLLILGFCFYLAAIAISKDGF